MFLSFIVCCLLDVDLFRSVGRCRAVTSQCAGSAAQCGAVLCSAEHSAEQCTHAVPCRACAVLRSATQCCAVPRSVPRSAAQCHAVPSCAMQWQCHDPAVAMSWHVMTKIHVQHSVVVVAWKTVATLKGFDWTHECFEFLTFFLKKKLTTQKGNTHFVQIFFHLFDVSFFNL